MKSNMRSFSPLWPSFSARLGSTTGRCLTLPLGRSPLSGCFLMMCYKTASAMGGDSPRSVGSTHSCALLPHLLQLRSTCVRGFALQHEYVAESL